MSDCPNCGNQLKRLKGKHKVAVQIDKRMTYADKLFEKRYLNVNGVSVLKIDDLVLAFLDKNREIKKKIKHQLKSYGDILHDEDRCLEIEQSHAFREIVKKCEEVKSK